MAGRLRDEQGFTLIELMAAIAVLAIGILVVMASYNSVFFSLRDSGKTAAASLVAERQLELYGSLAYASIGLDQSTLATVQASDSVYAADEAGLPGTGSDKTIASCGTSAQCLPVQTVTGSDGKSYRLETFIRDLPNGATWTERVVTVIVRDPNVSGSPKVVTMQTAVDKGP